MDVADLKLRFSTDGAPAAIGALRGVDNEVKTVEKDAKRAGVSFGGMGKGMLIGAAAVTAGVGIVGVGLFKIGDAYDAMTDHIAVATGKQGKELQKLDDAAMTVFKNVPTSMEIAGNAIASISAKTGDTGKDLVSLTESEIELARVTGTDLNSNIDESTKLFNNWNVASKDQTSTLDGLFNASQKYGVGVDVLMGQVETFTPQIKAMGLSLDEGANFIGKIDKAGGHVTTIMRGMTKETNTLAKSGVDVKTGMADVYDSINNAGSAAEANTIAVKAFGSKAGPELAQMIRNGTISVDDLTGAIDKTGKSILDTAKGTYDFSENWKLFKNNVEALLVPLGSFVFQGVNKIIPFLTKGVALLGKLGPAFRSVGDHVKQFTLAMKAAFDTGTRIKDLVEFLPPGLQNLEHGFLLVADAIGDVVRGFQVNGLAGAFDALGPAIQQAASGIGSVAINAVVDIAGWTLGAIIQPLGDWLDKLVGGKGALPAGDGTGGPDADGVNHVSVGTLLVDVAGWALGSALPDLWGWLKDQIGVGGTSATGDGTGGPDSDRKITISDVAVNVASWGKATFDAGTAALGTEINTALDAAGVDATIGDWKLHIGKPGLGTTIDFSLGAILKDAFANMTGKGSLGGANMFGPGTSQSASDLGQQAGKALVDLVIGGIKIAIGARGAVGGASPDGPQGGGGGESVGEVVFGLIKGVFSGAFSEIGTKLNDLVDPSFLQTVSDAGSKALTKISDSLILGLNATSNPAILQGISNAGANLLNQMSASLMGAFSGTSSASGAAGSLAGLASGDISATGGIVDSIAKFFTDIPGEVKDAVGSIDLDIPTPTLPDWLTDFTWITKPIDDAIAAIQGALAKLEFWKTKEAQAVPFNAGAHASSQGGGAFGNSNNPGSGTPDTNNNDPNAVPVVQPQGFNGPIKIPAPDTSAFDKGLADLGAKVAAQTFTSNLSAKTDLFEAATFAAARKGESFAGSVFTAALTAESSGVDGALFVAFSKVSAWDGHEFQARFTIDTSGLAAAESAAMAAVSFIDSIMPHSPAKRGPLSRLPRWGALFEGIGPAGAHAVGMATNHAAGIADAFRSGSLSGSYAGALSAGGGAPYIDMRGAVVGPGAVKEVTRMVNRGTARQIRNTSASRALSGSRLP